MCAPHASRLVGRTQCASHRQRLHPARQAARAGGWMRGGAVAHTERGQRARPPAAASCVDLGHAAGGGICGERHARSAHGGAVAPAGLAAPARDELADDRLGASHGGDRQRLLLQVEVQEDCAAARGGACPEAVLPAGQESLVQALDLQRGGSRTGRGKKGRLVRRAAPPGRHHPHTGARVQLAGAWRLRPLRAQRGPFWMHPFQWAPARVQCAGAVAAQPHRTTAAHGTDRMGRSGPLHALMHSTSAPRTSDADGRTSPHVQPAKGLGPLPFPRPSRLAILAWLR